MIVMIVMIVGVILLASQLLMNARAKIIMPIPVTIQSLILIMIETQIIL